ncbi:MAG: hypothetical protein JWN85_504 [Gammaproteobacteria bacterium]|nr:hypothetical protein [Gammaproteobacteria bacterium]
MLRRASVVMSHGQNGAPGRPCSYLFARPRQGFCSAGAPPEGALSSVGRSAEFPGFAISTGVGGGEAGDFRGRGVGRPAVRCACVPLLRRVFAGVRALPDVCGVRDLAEGPVVRDLPAGALTSRDCTSRERTDGVFFARVGLPFAGAGFAVLPPRRCLPRGGCAPASSAAARCAFFQTLRVEAACLRARRDSRFASLRRLRARFSSSLAMRTRCFATSACSRARSEGSAGAAFPFADSSEGDSLPVFFIRGPAKWAKGRKSHTSRRGLPP